jgi:predicted CXXCH cytochrome family protein
MVAGGGESRCLFCMYADRGPGVALQWALRSFDYDQLAGVVYAAECPSCHDEAFFPANDILGWDRQYCCFSCGVAGDYICCHNCGKMFENIDHKGICATCRAELADAPK